MLYQYDDRKADLQLFKGRDFKIEVIFEYLSNPVEKIDVTAATISASIREELNSDSPLIAHISIEKYIPEEGVVHLYIPRTVTAGFSQTYGYYDLTIENEDGFDVYMYGRIDFIETTTTPNDVDNVIVSSELTDLGDIVLTLNDSSTVTVGNIDVTAFSGVGAKSILITKDRELIVYG